MALASHPVGASASGIASRNLFVDSERGRFAPSREIFVAWNSSSSSRCGASNESSFSCRASCRSFITSCSSQHKRALCLSSWNYKCRVSNLTNGVSNTRSVRCSSLSFQDSDASSARAGDDAKLEKKKEQSFEEFLPDFDELSKDELQSFLNLELQSGLDMDTYKHYEIMFVIHEKNAEEVQTVIEKVTGFVLANKGFIYRINDWGMRRLAYKIKKAEKGNYVLMNIEIGTDVINDLNTMFEKDERVIRHMVMAQKEAISDDFEPPEEWRPSGASAEGEQAGEDDEDEEYEEYEEEEEEEGGEEELVQTVGDLVLERQK
ncbi:small subunit ribosomal protein S6 [Marchantia polymorpha subsp. ruderalis]|uniref:30S ribosomal protein S6 n=2 Tax=Marchantia polymorpha TaxID=3197 RepID=A0AAF6ALV5_MARPO|nr:hypothetical protein MARPO_0005s0049 [Marchantia polymorpha]BBM97425.1 hypothetical protein Mp_1g05580 [Marchantia polymorpha subsp. ruderalis]|eukprot:PTQ48378.1 hypothetical protein MARPO_0005s0049 [Marchantia polymorpha]